MRNLQSLYGDASVELEEMSHKNSSAVEIEADSKLISSHNSKLRKALPTRAERVRREEQKQMQSFVASLRAKGITDKKTINKMKNKFSRKSIIKRKFEAAGNDMKEFLEDCIEITCKDCAGVFEFTVAEQNFYKEKGFSAPIRCKPCQGAKKSRIENN